MMVERDGCIVKHSKVWDPRQGCEVNVTDVLTPGGSSRLTGVVVAPHAINAVGRARRQMRTEPWPPLI